MIGKTISHYKIIEKLGEGGMGIVYLAKDTKLDRMVALKFLPKFLSSDANEKERFFHEARAAASLTHQNVAVIYEIGEYESNIFLAMEYVDGEALKTLVEQKSELLTIMKVLEIAIQICEGLDAAHEKEIVHRDIKSDNIMMTKKGKVKVNVFMAFANFGAIYNGMNTKNENINFSEGLQVGSMTETSTSGNWE
ncbi:MAG: serine/threonine protein kinase [Bacteroidetes bacterium]|nr:serine/threonine protein kinase [Bacteroidota bacterium]